MQKPLPTIELDIPPEDLIEDLRQQAYEAADELNGDMPEKAFDLGLALKMNPEDMLEWDAAECIDRLYKGVLWLEAEITRLRALVPDSTDSSKSPPAEHDDRDRIPVDRPT